MQLWWGSKLGKFLPTRDVVAKLKLVVQCFIRNNSMLRRLCVPVLSAGRRYTINLAISPLRPPLPKLTRPIATVASPVQTTREPASMVPDAPAQEVGEPVVLDEKTYLPVKEGLATILVETKDGDSRQVQQVFYNPIQQFNRDLTVLVIKAYGEETLERRRRHIAEKKESKKRKRQEKEDMTTKAKAARIDGEKVGHVDDGSLRETTARVEGEASAPAADGRQIQERDGSDAAWPDVTTQHAAVAEETGDARNGTSTPGDDTSRAGQDGLPKQASNGTRDGGEQARDDTRAPPKELSFTILDALSASGLRALRYGHEIPFATSITANDLSEEAAESIRRNVSHNALDARIQVTQGDANAHMMSLIVQDLLGRDFRGNPGKAHKYDVVDLDPYGTAAPFWDNALNCVKDDGGLLCVTCTDSAVWAGTSYGEKCEALYGGQPIKSLFCHEAGLRLIIGGIAAQAAKHGLAIEPILSLSIDFYARVFIKVTKSPAAVKFHGAKKMTVFFCEQGCGAWTTQFSMKSVATPNKKGTAAFYKHVTSLGPPTDQKCEHCGTKTRLAGPMWGGYLHSPAFVRKVLDTLPGADPAVYQTLPRIEGMLSMALEECLMPAEDPDTDIGLPADEKAWAMRDSFPFYVMPAHLSGILRCQTPQDDMIRGALRHLGYRTARSHCKAGTVKTDAPWSVIWRLMKEWARQKSPVRTEKLTPTMAAYRLLGLDKQPAAADSTTPAESDGQLASADSKPANKADKESAREQLWATLVFDDKLRRFGMQIDEKHLVRYQTNPREHWGPMKRAKGH